MQDWVAASDLVSYLEHTGYMNNALFVYMRVEGGFGTIVKIKPAFLKNWFQRGNWNPPRSHQDIPSRSQGDLRVQSPIQLQIHQSHLTASQEPTLFSET